MKMKVRLWINNNINCMTFEYPSEEVIKLLVNIAHMGIIDKFEILFGD